MSQKTYSLLQVEATQTHVFPLQYPSEFPPDVHPEWQSLNFQFNLNMFVQTGKAFNNQHNSRPQSASLTHN